MVNTSLEKEKEKFIREEFTMNELNAEDDLDSKESNKNFKNVTLKELRLNPEDNVILILGSEGFGVSKEISDKFVSFNVYIPPKLDKEEINQHPFNIIDSLNVGVTAGIIMDKIVAELYK